MTITPLMPVYPRCGVRPVKGSRVTAAVVARRYGHPDEREAGTIGFSTPSD